MEQQPSMTSDGTHIIPILAVKCRGCAAYERATGEVRWNPEEGATYSMEFPGVAVARFVEYCGDSADGSGAGTVSKFRRDADWTGKTIHGGEIKLFATTKEPVSTHTYGTSDSQTRITVKGHAAFVSVELPRDSELAFWHDTTGKHRFSFVGFDTLHWPQCDKNVFTIGNCTTETWRCSLTLSEQPSIKIVGGGPCEQTRELKYAWAVIDDKESIDDWSLSGDGLATTSFLSFILGVRTPFLWRDTLSNRNCLSRVYYGWQKVKTNRRFVPQPLPLGGIVEASQYGRAVIDALPRLFKSFLELHKTYDIDWIVSPLWYALDAFVDDQLTLACVSLERFRSAHTGHRKSCVVPHPQVAFWTEQQEKHIREALTMALQKAANETGVLEDKMKLLANRINQLGQMPNASNLVAVFEAVGVKLTDDEKNAIAMRNVCLHGNRTMKDSGSGDGLNQEIRRFDILRMVIYKAVLSLLDYDGPYIDYAERPPRGNFPIRMMNACGRGQTGDGKKALLPS